MTTPTSSKVGISDYYDGPEQPTAPANRDVEVLARALLLETVRAMATAGGLLSDEGVRESVRQACVFYAELETATPRAPRDEPTTPTARTVDDGIDNEPDTSGLADLL